MDSEIIPSQCVSQSIGTANQLISILLGTLISSHCRLSNEFDWPDNYGSIALAKQRLEPYDFVIIGAGTAGSVLANRLTENPNWNVLVIEAGDDPPIESEIPLLAYSLQNSSVDWKYFADKSKKYGTGHNMGIAMPRGKMLGGTSSMNHMLYIRGNKKDYDDWEAFGNPTWNYENVLQYFKKSENMLDEEILESHGRKFHSSGGLLDIGKFSSNSEIKKIILDAYRELNSKILLDFNGMEHIGTAEITATISNGVRSGPAKSFLATAKDRPNLHVIKNAHVTSLEFDPFSYGGRKRISAVNFVINKQHKLRAVATKEYILSAGVFNSPQILMLSGIGPSKHLNNFNIPSMVDLRVGMNLQDHVIVPYVFKLPRNTSFQPFDIFKDYSNYLLTKTGIFAENAAFDIMTFVNTKSKYINYPDVQFIYNFNEKNNLLAIDAFVTALGFEGKFKESLLRTQKDFATLIVGIILLNTKSQGKVELRSSDPFDPVRITPNYLSYKDEIKTLIRGIRQIQKLQGTRTFLEYGIEEFIPEIEECENKKSTLDSEAFWECYIRYTSMSGYHNVGTCKMGPPTDYSSVVDSKLSVYGINNLRVVDSSVMPKIVSGNTFAPTVMIAEKASDIIKEYWDNNFTN